MSDSATTDVLLDALESATIYDLAQPLQNGMTSSPSHPSFHMALWRRHGDRERADGTSSASEIIVTGGHVGTHVDALSHFSDAGKLHGGIDAHSAQETGLFTSHGAETIPPFVRRGVLLDIATTEGQDVLAPGTEINSSLLSKAAARRNITINPGDVVLIRTGWSTYFADSERYLGLTEGAPGVTLDGAKWLADAGVVAIGGDTASVEVIPAGNGHSILPVHRFLLYERGIYLIEVLDLEKLAQDQVTNFLFILAPLKIIGATGSPVRPLAVNLP